MKVLIIFLLFCLVHRVYPATCNDNVKPHCLQCRNSPLKCTKCEDGYGIVTSKCVKCHETCKSCSGENDPSKCKTCYEGNVLKKPSGSTSTYGTCEPCGDENCIACDTTAGTCAQCKPKYYIDQTDNICKPCSDVNCANCKGPNSEDCQVCEDGYFLGTGNKCQQCENNCKKCTDKDTCTECKEGFFANSANDCESCHPTCKTCDNEGEDHCTECHQGFYLNNNYCLPCGEHCTSCKGQGTCDECEDKYFLLSNQCNSCKENSKCDTCEYSNGVICKTCLSGYYLKLITGTTNQYMCESCNDDGCLKCQGSKDCQICKAGFFLEGKTCSQCNSNCKTCKETNAHCTDCHTKFYLSLVDNTCKPCTDNCLECDKDKCDKCADKFYLFNGKCESCDKSCKTCDTKDKCIECETGYQSDGKGTCFQCKANCDKCNATHCLDCAPQFFIDSNGLCQPCAEVCYECTGPSDEECYECDPGFYFSHSLRKCFKCHEACSVCNGPNDYNCSVCSPGYFLDPLEWINPYLPKADRCVSCEHGCLTCNSLTNCTGCKEGYYLENADCHFCDSGCKECTAPGKCTKCFDGYFISSTNDEGFVTCESCTTNCKECSSKETCNKCFDGSYLDDKKECINCPYPCKTCTSKDKCNSCFNGYLFDGVSKCNSQCEPSCESCIKTASTCTSCHEGFILNGTFCIKCPEGCKTCEVEESSYTCTSCLDGYYRLDEECYKCDSSCEKCFGSSSKDCYTCKEGFFAYYVHYDPFSVECLPCNDTLYGAVLCSKCTSKCDEYSFGQCEFTCTVCNDGYFLNTLQNNICQNCASNCKSCTGGAINDCLECKEGFILQVDEKTGDKSCKDLTGNCGDGFYLNQTNQCEKCPAGCKYCTEDPTEGLKCAGCIEGHQLVGNVCTVLPVDSCIEQKHCSYDNTNNDDNVHIVIEKTTIDSYHSETNGGFVDISNCDFIARNMTISSCTSRNGGGGIFINNYQKEKNPQVSITNVKFNSCQAKYGGAVFIYSNLENLVEVKNCEFIDNKITEQSPSGKLHGGSAIYMIALNGVIKDCILIRNKGKGGSVKLSDNFDDKPEVKILEKQIGISIDGCKFEIEKNDDCSLFYQRKHISSKVEVKNCIFTGYLANDSYFIDGESTFSNEKPNLKIMSCMFSSNSKKALNKKFSIIEVTDQVFNYKENNSQSMNFKLYYKK